MQRVLTGAFATSRVLFWLLMGVMVSLRPLRILGQSDMAPVIAMHPLQAAQDQSGKFEFEVASVRSNEKGKYADPGYSLDSDEDYTDIAYPG
jgi:hypothetical protein